MTKDKHQLFSPESYSGLMCEFQIEIEDLNFGTSTFKHFDVEDNLTGWWVPARNFQLPTNLAKRTTVTASYMNLTW